jgi:hypothetical protein
MDEFERTANDIEKRLDRMQDKEDHFKDEVVRYLDRINDKLFTLNNLFIGAYFALIAIKPQAPKLVILIPLINSLIIGFVDWLLMESFRRMSHLMSMSMVQIDEETKKMDAINLISFGTIVTTVIVLGMLVGYVIYYL